MLNILKSRFTVFFTLVAPPKFEETRVYINCSSFSFKVSIHPITLNRISIGKAQISFSADQTSKKSISRLPCWMVSMESLPWVCGLVDRLNTGAQEGKHSWQLASAIVIVIVQRINTLPETNIAFSKWCLEHYLLFLGRHNIFRCEVEVSGRRIGGFNPSPFECREGSPPSKESLYLGGSSHGMKQDES